MSSNEIVIDFFLRGEWYTKTSPVDHLPSHGTNRFGLRYAMDFVKKDLNNSNQLTHNKNNIDYFFKGIPLESYYCFNENIYAPFSGEVVAVENNIFDGKKAFWFTDQLFAIRNSLFFNAKRDGFASIAGNYIILKKEPGVYGVFCHLKKDSILVKVKERVEKNQHLAKIGHSGNSTEPHLHFQMMDSMDIENAKGLSFVFAEYEMFDGLEWKTIKNKIPTAKDYIRFIK